MEKLSVIIPTFNEELHIEGVLESVKWADEIIIVDSYSTDRTLELARKFPVKIFERTYTGPADQKNWAIPQATHNWILLMDADERVKPRLKEEIQTFLRSKNSDGYDAFWIGRENYFFGQRIHYSGWQGDAVIRLIQKKCRYEEKQVHEEIDTTGIKVGRLRNKLEHYTYRSSGHFLAKMERYSEWSAQDHIAKTPKVTLFHLWVKPVFRFFKHYVLQRGFLDGKIGFIISVIMAWGVFLRYVKILELQKHKSNHGNF